MSTHRRFFFSLVALAVAVPTSVVSGVGSAAGAGATPDALDSSIVGVMDQGYDDDVVVVSDRVAYLGGLDGLAIYDVTAPADPGWLGGTDGWIHGIAKEGHVLYVTEGGDDSSQIVALDVTDPAHLGVLAHIDPPLVPGMPPDAYPQLEFESPLLVSGGYLYAVSRHFQNPWTQFRALAVYDVHNPASPVLLSTTALLMSTDAEDLVLRNGYLYVGDRTQLEVVDVSDPTEPTRTASVDTPSYGLAVDGPLLYSCYATIAGKVEVFTLGDPGHPKYEGFISGPSDLLTCVDVEVTHPAPGMTAMVAAWQADSFQWVEVYDVTPPIKVGDASLLMDLGEIEGLPTTSVNDVELDGSYVYVAQYDSDVPSNSGVRVAQVDYTKAVDQAPVLTKHPAADRVVLRRSGKAVRWRYFVTVASPSGDPVGDKTVKIQRSLNGRTWKTLGSYATDDQGLAGVRIRFTSRGTTSWRWSSPAEGSWLAARTSRTKVIVK